MDDEMQILLFFLNYIIYFYMGVLVFGKPAVIQFCINVSERCYLFEYIY